ncbi:MAG: acyltransferase [Verrucomicrobiota bacterium]
MKALRTLDHDWFPQPLPDNFEMGERSWCYSSFCCLHLRSKKRNAVRIGTDTGIYAGTFFELGPEGTVEIGNYCTLVGAIISTNSRVVIHDYVFLAHEVVLAGSFAARPFPLSADPADRHETEREPDAIVIGDNCWICARAVLLSGARIGEGAIVGAAAVVNFEVPPYAIVAGNPARVVGWTHAIAAGAA